MAAACPCSIQKRFSTCYLSSDLPNMQFNPNSIPGGDPGCNLTPEIHSPSTALPQLLLTPGDGPGRNLSWVREGYQPPVHDPSQQQQRGQAGPMGRGRGAGSQQQQQRQFVPRPRPPSLLEKLLSHDIRYAC
eukprot:scaffold27879_cov15-Tisochrysis_lutea.AAC.1